MYRKILVAYNGTLASWDILQECIRLEPKPSSKLPEPFDRIRMQLVIERHALIQIKPVGRSEPVGAYFLDYGPLFTIDGYFSIRQFVGFALNRYKRLVDDPFRLRSYLPLRMHLRRFESQLGQYPVQYRHVRSIDVSIKLRDTLPSAGSPFVP